LGSFGASSLRPHIGLGKAAVVDQIEIRWPGSGLVQRFDGPIPADRRYEIREGRPTLKPIEVRSLRAEGAERRQSWGSRRSAERGYSAEGEVKAILPQWNMAVIAHSEIKGAMPPMTMGFRAEDPKVLAGIEIGDRVRFRLKEAGDRLILEQIEKVQPRR